MLAVNFGLILVSYRIFGKTGLYAWTPLAAIVANIQVVKLVELFGTTATLGNIVYASSFLVTDILSEMHGKKQAQKAVFIGLFSLVAMTVLMNLALFFTPAPDDFSQDSLAVIFGFMPRIAAASLLAYLVSQMHDVWAYDFWRKRFPGLRFIWLRNNASTMVSQFIDSTVFTVLAFWGCFPPVFGADLLDHLSAQMDCGAWQTPRSSTWPGAGMTKEKYPGRPEFLMRLLLSHG